MGNNFFYFCKKIEKIMCEYYNPIVKEDVVNIIKSIKNTKYFEGKKILVTGANGFIPGYIVYTLLGLNDNNILTKKLKVLALVRNKEKAEKKFSKLINRDDFELIVSDVCDINLSEKTDIVIHAASQASPKFYGKDPVGTLKANTLGTAKLLDYSISNGVEKFLYVSSGEVYGVIDGSIPEITENYTGNVDITDVRSCYAEGKRMGENMCVCYSHQFGIHTNMVRLSHTYGPTIKLDDGRVFADFANCVVQGKNIVLNSDGSAKRSFLYISDMIIALFTVLLNAPTCQAYNIAADTQTSILDLANTLCNLYPEKNLKVEFKANTDANYIRSKSTSAELSAKKLKQLGWQQTINIKDGFKRMIDSYLI